MAKIVWKTSPLAAYEWVEVEGGDTMKPHEVSAMLDDFIVENGLVPVETTFLGEVPTHRYGRYKADYAPPSALPVALPSRETDAIKLGNENAVLKQQIAQLQDQLGRKRKGRADVVDAVDTGSIPASGGPSGTDEIRANLNTQDGVDLVGSGEEIRKDMTTADRSDNNPKIG